MRTQNLKPHSKKKKEGRMKLTTTFAVTFSEALPLTTRKYLYYRDNKMMKMGGGRRLQQNNALDNKSPEDACRDVQLVVEPTPINIRRVKIRNQLPISESNLLTEGDDFIQSVISHFSTSSPSSSKRPFNNVRTMLPEQERLSYAALRDDDDDDDGSGRRRRKKSKKQRCIRGAVDDSSSDDIPTTVQSTSTTTSCSPSVNEDCSATTSTSDSKTDSFRNYQIGLWDTRYRELCDYTETYGNCLVPDKWKSNIILSKWIKRQRYQHKLKMQGKHSTLSDDREAALEQLGFIWDSHKAKWEEHFQQLCIYKAQYGHCNVPSTYTENRSLSIWVQCQRRQYKTFLSKTTTTTSDRAGHDDEEASSSSSPHDEKNVGGGYYNTAGQGMPIERIEKLEALGFVWNPQNGRTTNNNA